MLNDRHAGRIYLEQDWNSYEILISKDLWTIGDNKVEFNFPYSSQLDWHGINPDHNP